MPDDLKREKYLKLFLSAVEKEEYVTALEYFEVLDLDSSQSKDNNLYLMLLSQCMNVGRNYKDRLVTMGFRDVHDPVNSNDKEKMARKLVFSHKFSQARRMYAGIAVKSLEEEVILELLRKAASKLQIQNKEAIRLIKREKYQELVDMYKSISGIRPLCHFEKVVLMMSKDLNKMILQGEVPKVISGPSRNAEDLIILRDYMSALRELPMQGYNNLIYLLLNKLTVEIRSRRVEFSDVVEVISKKDANDIKRTIGSYLKNIGCLDYVRFINDLVSLSIYNEDYDYQEVLLNLGQIRDRGKDSYFDVDLYLARFYEALEEGELAKAKIYLDIVSQSRTLCDRVIDVYFMRLKLYDVASKFKEDNLDEKYALLSDVLSDINETKGLRVLEKLSPKEQEEVVRIVSKFPNILASSIDGRLVLRYHNTFEPCPEFYYLKRDGNEALYVKDYDRVIECYNTICTKLMSPSPEVFQKIGTAYLERGSCEEDYQRAIDYLWVAAERGKLVEDKLAKAREMVSYKGERVFQYTKK